MPCFFCRDQQAPTVADRCCHGCAMAIARFAERATRAERSMVWRIKLRPDTSRTRNVGGWVAVEALEPALDALEAAVDEFRKRIQPDPAANDERTMADLAIAYGEMGLLDDAIPLAGHVLRT